MYDILAFTNHHQSLIHSQRRGFANAARQLGTVTSSAFKVFPGPVKISLFFFERTLGTYILAALPNSSFV